MNIAIDPNLPIFDQQGVYLDETTISTITHHPNGELKARHAEISKEIQKYAEKVNIISFLYKSSGENVKAYLLQPKTSQNGALVFFNRSGTGEFGVIEKRTLYTNFFGLKSLLLSGYSIVISQLHGVDGGSGLSDSCGPKDLICLDDLYKIASNFPSIDKDKIGMMGGSSGGLLTYQSAKMFKWLKTGIVIASPVDDELSFFERGVELKNAKSKHYDIEDKNERYFRSPIKWAAELSANTPLYIMHGTADWRVDMCHSLDMAKELYRYQKPFRLQIYEGADHSLREYQKDVSEEIVTWFDDYIINDKNLPNLEKHGL